MTWWHQVVIPAKSFGNYVANRFVRKPRLELIFPRAPIRSCLLPGDGLAKGLVPVVLGEVEAPYAEQQADILRLKCLCLEVRNNGWEQDAVNCILKATLLGSQAFPLTAYWMLPASDAEYTTIPRKDKRNIILCLIDEESLEGILSTWVHPVVTTPNTPRWQLRTSLACVIHIRVELLADNARTVYGDLFIELTGSRPVVARAVRWRTWRGQQKSSD